MPCHYYALGSLRALIRTLPVQVDTVSPREARVSLSHPRREGLGHISPVDHRENLSERPPAVGPRRIFISHLSILRPTLLSVVQGVTVASARMDRSWGGAGASRDEHLCDGPEALQRGNVQHAVSDAERDELEGRRGLPCARVCFGPLYSVTTPQASRRPRQAPSRTGAQQSLPLVVWFRPGSKGGCDRTHISMRDCRSQMLV